jgi:Common central domain of tyrosinase
MIRRVTWLALLVVCVASLSALGQAPRKRISIDDPAFDLDGYKIAIEVLKQRDPSKDDKTNWINNSYEYFERLHDDFSNGGGCIHGSEVFLPWHREMLYRFEMAVRATKPGRTDNLTLPYWNWTLPATGTNYPKAFEDPSSVLFMATRAVPPGGKYTVDPIQKMLNARKVWSGTSATSFAGGKCTVKAGCVSGNCSQCPAGIYGGLENPFHNDMHDWLGEPMNDTRTAARDPIFWSFHTFIDVIYQQWQCKYPAQVPTCPNCNFRAMVDRKVRDVIDIERQLGYVYDIVPSCQPAMPPPPALAAGAVATPSPAGREGAPAAPENPLVDAEQTIGLTAAGSTAGREGGALTGLGPFIFDVKLPEPTFESADLVLEGLTLPTEFSYGGDVFLYPPNVTLKATDADFVSRYRVGRVSVWERSDLETEGGDHAMHGGATAAVNVTPDLLYLGRVNRGATWKVAVVFQPPTSVDAGLTAAEAVRHIRIGSVRLVLNDDTQ